MVSAKDPARGTSFRHGSWCWEAPRRRYCILRSGASWEGYALDQVLRIARPDEAYFWATHAGAELDLLMIKDGRHIGVEFKRADAPQMTPSMRIALNDLALDALYVVYSGERRYRLGERVEVVPLASVVAR